MILHLMVCAAFSSSQPSPAQVSPVAASYTTREDRISLPQNAVAGASASISPVAYSAGSSTPMFSYPPPTFPMKPFYTIAPHPGMLPPNALPPGMGYGVGANVEGVGRPPLLSVPLPPVSSLASEVPRHPPPLPVPAPCSPAYIQNSSFSNSGASSSSNTPAHGSYIPNLPCPHNHPYERSHPQVAQNHAHHTRPSDWSTLQRTKRLDDARMATQRHMLVRQDQRSSYSSVVQAQPGQVASSSSSLSMAIPPPL